MTEKPETVKALTICQPYAEMIVRGEKVIENRTWPTRYRGPLLIHAGKSRSWLDDDDEQLYPGMVFGAIVGRCQLVDCLRLEALPFSLQSCHANGPWCWVLEDIERFDVPIPCSGSQGLWDFPKGVA